MTAVKLFKIRRGERTFRKLDEGDAISLTETLDDRIIIDFNGNFTGNLTIAGDLTVNGTTTTINSTTHDINDNVIVLNDGESGAGVVTLGTVSGFEVDRGTLNNNVRWVWEEVTDRFRGEFVTSGFIAAVEADQLMFTDHGSNSQTWTVEEDSSGSNTNALTFDYSGTERLRLTPTSRIDPIGINDSSGNDVVLFAENASAVNEVTITNAATASGPTISATGTDTNINLELAAKGTGVVNITGAVTVSSTVDGRDLAIDGAKLDLIEANATADQTAADIRGLGFFDTTNDGTGSGLDADLLDGSEATAFATTAQGTLADSALQNVVEDTSPQLGAQLDVNTFGLGDGTNLLLDFVEDASAVNYIEIENEATGSGPIVRSVGADTNVDLVLDPKGAGNVVIDGLRYPEADGTNTQVLTTDGSGNLTFEDASGGISNVVEDTSPQLGAQLDVNTFGLGDGTNLLLDFVEDASAVNHIEIENEATGSGPIVRAVGADTDVDLNLEPKGTGAVQIGIPDLVGITPVISAIGADTNIDLRLSPKGTGVVDITGAVTVSSTVDGRDIAADGALLDTALQNVVEDTTPQLGGQLDVNSNGFGDGTNVLLDFVEDASAVNNVQIENEATGSGPIVRAVGADTNIDLNFESKGVGEITANNPVVLPTFTVAGAPTSTAGAIAFFSDGAAGSPVLAFADGANWLRCDTLAIVAAA